MRLDAIYHEAKSRYAYAFDKETIHIRLRTAKGDADRISLIYGDPFHWGPKDDNPEEWEWKGKDVSESVFMEKEYTTENHDYYFVSVKPEWKRAKYAFVLEKKKELVLFGSREAVDLKKEAGRKFDLTNYFNFPYINGEDVFDAPKWLSNTVWYQIFTERFRKGDHSLPKGDLLAWGSTDDVRNDMFFGGDLRGVIDSLDYLSDLGISGIYFTPIFESPSSHKYDTTDYFEIDKKFGTNELFGELVKEAHKRRIKVILDAVFNHCGFDHPFFADVRKKGKASKYYECFHIDGDEVMATRQAHNYETFAFTHMMPKWNTESNRTREYLFDVTRYWMTEYSVDGYRLDVSNEVSHDFWREFRKVVKQVNPEAVIIGENWDESNPWLHTGQFDSVMNYELLMPVWSYFGDNPLSGRRYNTLEFTTAMNKLLTEYPKNVLPSMFNMLDCHDTARLLTVCGDKRKAMLAYVFQMTMAGSPSIYYGSEIGLMGKNDPDNRRCMIWDENLQDKAMRSHVKRLIAIRKDYPELRSVDVEWIDPKEGSGLLVYRKKGTKVKVIINNSDGDIKYKAGSGRALDIYSGHEVDLSKGLTLMPYEFYILKEID